MLAALLATATLAGIPAPSAQIVNEPCPVQSAADICVDTTTRTVYAPGNSSQFAVQHELGHLFDAQYLDDGERNALKRATGMPITRPWSTGTGLAAEGLASPSERFADLYAACRLRMDPDTRWESAYDYQPSRKRFRRACGVLRRAAADYSDGSTVMGRPGSVAST